jgi:hypothetical protein
MKKGIISIFLKKTWIPGLKIQKAVFKIHFGEIEIHIAEFFREILSRSRV